MFILFANLDFEKKTGLFQEELLYEFIQDNPGFSSRQIIDLTIKQPSSNFLGRASCKLFVNFCGGMIRNIPASSFFFNAFPIVPSNILSYFYILILIQPSGRIAMHTPVCVYIYISQAYTSRNSTPLTLYLASNWVFVETNLESSRD